MSEKKVVSRKIAITLGMMCITLMGILVIVLVLYLSTTTKPINVKVGAYYYVWYGNNNNGSALGGLGSSHWNDSQGNIVVDTPLDGFYSSANPDEIHKQLQEMVNIGIDFLVISWWDINDYTDNNSQLAFSIIQNYSLPIRACILVELSTKAAKTILRTITLQPFTTTFTILSFCLIAVFI